jgi:hypothetical protein
VPNTAKSSVIAEPCFLLKTWFSSVSNGRYVYITVQQYVQLKTRVFPRLRIILHCVRILRNNKTFLNREIILTSMSSCRLKITFPTLESDTLFQKLLLYFSAGTCGVWRWCPARRGVPINNSYLSAGTKNLNVCYYKFFKDLAFLFFTVVPVG